MLCATGDSSLIISLASSSAVPALEGRHKHQHEINNVRVLHMVWIFGFLPNSVLVQLQRIVNGISLSQVGISEVAAIDYQVLADSILVN
jgi:hypothetical protein